MALVAVVLRLVGDSENEVDNNSQEKDNSQNGGTETVIETGLAPHSYRLGSPMVCYQCVDHGQHGDAGEEECRDEGDSIAKVEHANGKGAKDDGEVEP